MTATFQKHLREKTFLFCPPACIFWLAVVGVAGPAHAENAPPTIPPHVGSIDLGEALQRTLLSNPDLAVFSWDIRMAEARLLQAHARPNPDLIVEVEDVRLTDGPGTKTHSQALGLSSTGVTAANDRSTAPGTPAGISESQITVRLSQLVELGGKRAKRIHAADTEKSEINWEYETARLDALEETGKRFIEVLSAQEKIALADQEAERTHAIADAVKKRVDAGAVSPIEQSRAETEQIQAELAAARAKRELGVAAAALSALWGSTTADFDHADGDLDGVEEAPALDDLLKELDRNPDLARWSTAIEAREAQLAVERAARHPDLTVEAGIRMQGVGGSNDKGAGLDTTGALSLNRTSTSPDSNRQYSVVFGFSLPLPLFDRKRGSVQEAEYAVSKAHDEQRREALAVETKVRTASATLTESFNAVQTLRDSVVPKAREVHEKTQIGYREGKFGLFEVLDAQRAFIDAQKDLVDAQSEYLQTMNALERLTGDLRGTNLDAPAESAASHDK